MKKYIVLYGQKALKVLPIVIALAFVLSFAHAHPTFADATGDIRSGVNSVGGNSNRADFRDILKNVINVLLFLVGAAAVIMLIVGGFRYVTANGESSNITAAKNIILYSIVGIVVALSAFALVNFILDQF